MIPVDPPTRQNEPPLFDLNCRQPGEAWLQVNPTEAPHKQSAWWSAFQHDLAEHFQYRCGWEAMWIGRQGIVEHWLSCGPRQGAASPHRHLAFEWTNYRYATGVINSLKNIFDDKVLDPCEVQDGWFEVLLPSFQLVATARVPADLRAKAEFTLERLQLRRGERVRWTRWSWYQRCWNHGAPDMANLRIHAPLVAVAVETTLANGRALPDPDAYEPREAIAPRRRPYQARQR